MFGARVLDGKIFRCDPKRLRVDKRIEPQIEIYMFKDIMSYTVNLKDFRRVVLDTSAE